MSLAHLKFVLLVAVCFCSATSVRAQANSPADAKDLYEQIKAFPLTGGSLPVKALTLNRDRAKMVFDGTFYFAAPVNGRVTGCVFIGEGKFTSEIPPSEFEKGNVKRLLGVDIIESDFKSAVLRFSDDTADLLGKPSDSASADPQAQKLAKEHDARILKQTGANLAARIALSILNQENPGFFFATFDGGKRGRFSLVLDHQNRIPVANFGINGGEKGLIFSYKSDYYYNEVWLAFYAQEDYRRGVAVYSDIHDLIDIIHYNLNVDLREHKKAVRLLAKAKAKILAPKVRALSFDVGEDLGDFESWRLNKQMRLKAARLGNKELAFAQEDWEGGITLFLPSEVSAGESIELELSLEGDFMYDAEEFADCHYPRSSVTWFPRHGYLDRATFDLTFRHPKKLRVASAGLRIAEDPETDDKNVVRTTYRVDQPIPVLTFALAPFQRHAKMAKFDLGGVGDSIPIEFYSLPGDYKAIREDLILAELDNSLRYFTRRFGRYPYSAFRAAYHASTFGLGFPSLLMLPTNTRDSKHTYAFIAHETAHQWWGDIVAWRSYRDQWLSEGFAEYSGILYAGSRGSPGEAQELLGELRESLRLTPRTETGLGKGRLIDVGPIILGHRLSTRKTQGAYQALIYSKGALVLRMLHFLLTDPSSGLSNAFFEMMTDFVKRYENKAASTDDFRRVANEHFAKSTIGQEYGLNNLDWFFQQYVYRTEFPSYELEYQIQDQPDGKSVLSGTVKQENAPDGWFMVLPLVVRFSGKQEAHTSVHANGPSAKFQIKLPARPTSVELDPDHWVLADKVSTKRVGS